MNITTNAKLYAEKKINSTTLAQNKSVKLLQDFFGPSIIIYI